MCPYEYDDSQSGSETAPKCQWQCHEPPAPSPTRPNQTTLGDTAPMITDESRSEAAALAENHHGSEEKKTDSKGYIVVKHSGKICCIPKKSPTQTRWQGWSFRIQRTDVFVKFHHPT